MKINRMEEENIEFSGENKNLWIDKEIFLMVEIVIIVLIFRHILNEEKKQVLCNY